MRNYSVRDGERGYLPPLVPGTTDLVAVARPDTPFACVRAGMVRVTIHNRTLQNEVCAEMVLRVNDYHVMTQPGNQFALSSLDVILSGSAAVSIRHPEAFRLGEAVTGGLDRSIDVTMANFWSERDQEVTVHELWRRRNALVLGRIAREAEPGTWLETDTGRFLVQPGSYILQEFSGRGVRVVPRAFMSREFTEVRHMTSGAVVERFPYTPST